MDDKLRNLEQRAALGDEDAIRELDSLNKRMKEHYHCLVWSEIFRLLGFNYASKEESLMELFFNLSFETTENHFSDREDDDLESLKDEFRLKVEALCMEKFYKECQAAALTAIEEMVENINRWAKRGIQSAIYQKASKRKAGLAVELITLNNTNYDDPAICFQLHQPFLVAYAEAVAAIYGMMDQDEELKDMTANSVIVAGRCIAEAEGLKSPLRKMEDYIGQLDLTPDYYEIKKLEKSND